MREVGISIGKENIGMVITEKDKIIFSRKYEVGEGDLEVIIDRFLSNQVKKEDNIYLTLPEKDIILRSFTLPLMNKKEIESGISFEVEKYIPFNIEELIWDYNYRVLFRKRKVIVSFLAIKEEKFEQIKKAISKIGSKLSLVEPHFFSLFRLVKSKKKYLKYNGLAIFDLTSEEYSFTFFFKELALFNRNFSLSRDLILDLDLSSEIVREKILEEIRFSLQYFYRDFNIFPLDRLVIILGEKPSDEKSFLSLKKDLGIEIDLISIEELSAIKEKEPEIVKAYGATRVDYLPVKIIPIRKKTPSFLYTTTGVKKSLFNFFLVESIIGLFFLAVVIAFFQTKINKLIAYVEKEEKKLSFLPFKEKSIKNLKKMLKEQKKALEEIDEITPQEVSFLFESIEENIPEGMWLEKLRVDFEKGKGSISGYICLNDYFQERRKIEEFALCLSKNSKVSNIFPYIKVLKKEKRVIQGFEVTYFEIELKR